MTRYVKLTTPSLETYGGFTYAVGVTHTADLSRPARLCTPGVLHAYTHPEMAALMAPAHTTCRAAWWAESADPTPINDGTKVGVRSLRLVAPLILPRPTIEQRIQWALACVWSDPHTPVAYQPWAARWLSGSGARVSLPRWTLTAVLPRGIADNIYSAMDSAEAISAEGMETTPTTYYHVERVERLTALTVAHVAYGASLRPPYDPSHITQHALAILRDGETCAETLVRLGLTYPLDPSRLEA